MQTDSSLSVTEWRMIAQRVFHWGHRDCKYYKCSFVCSFLSVPSPIGVWPCQLVTLVVETFLCDFGCRNLLTLLLLSFLVLLVLVLVLLVFVFRTALMEGWGQLTAWRQLFRDCYILYFFQKKLGQ